MNLQNISESLDEKFRKRKREVEQAKQRNFISESAKEIVEEDD